MRHQTANKAVHFSRAALIKPVLDYLESRGVTVEKYLVKAGISPQQMRDAVTPIPRSLIFRFVNEVCLEESIEDIGLEVGQTTSLRMMGEFGATLLGEKNIGDYLECGCRLISTASSGDYYWLVEGDRQTRFCASVAGLDEEDAVQNYLYIILATINTIRDAASDDWTPSKITIPGIKPRSVVRLAEILPGATILPEGKYASFSIPDALLALPMRSSARPAEAGKTTLPHGFADSFAQLLETLVVTGHSDLQSAADATDLSRRTLQRKLAECGLSFTEMLVQARIRIATRWIHESDSSLNEIARSLGYADPANFTRAFRRITGLSPSSYRKQFANCASHQIAPAGRPLE